MKNITGITITIIISFLTLGVLLLTAPQETQTNQEIQTNEPIETNSQYPITPLAWTCRKCGIINYSSCGGNDCAFICTCGGNNQ